MKHEAIVCNIGHFDSEIDIAGLRTLPWENIKPQVDHVVFPDGKKVIVLAEGRLVNLGCATGHSSFVMSASFANQVMAQIELWNNPTAYEARVYNASEALGRKGRAPAFGQDRAHLTRLTPEQAAYINVPVEGPYKPSRYRY